MFQLHDLYYEHGAKWFTVIINGVDKRVRIELEELPCGAECCGYEYRLIDCETNEVVQVS